MQQSKGDIMLNRRDLLKSLGVASVFNLSTPSVAEEPKKKSVELQTSNRRLRYKHCEKFIANKADVFADFLSKTSALTDKVYKEAVGPLFTTKRVWRDLPDVNHLKAIFSRRKIGFLVFDACLYGDFFGEIVLDNDNHWVGKPITWCTLPCDSIYRIETVKGKLLEFQQSKESPDYASLSRATIDKASQEELAKSTAVRFRPNQIVHIRINCRKYHPYGTSCLEKESDGKSRSVFPPLGFPVIDSRVEEDLVLGIKELIDRMKL
jgi:hypothetical protein